MDLALLIFLVLINGIFAMSEMALAASRKARLQVMAETGDSGAVAAMVLHDNPTQFLSTVQIGITSIGVLNGIVGEAAFSPPLAEWLHAQMPITERAASIASTGLVVVIITFISIIFGELVPKRVGQMYPEPVARLVAKPMLWLSSLALPFVKLLAASTEGILRLLGVRDTGNRSVTEEEIAAQLEEGLDAGVIEAHEHQMVRNVFRLDERHIGSMMIPRSDIAWLDIELPMADNLAIIAEHGYSRYPVCRGGLGDVVGVTTAQQLLHQLTQHQIGNLSEGLLPAVFVPETLSGMELLEHFRGSDTQMVFVVDEYGEVQGVITLRDVLEAITGEFTPTEAGDAWAIQRDDGSWLVDGLIPIPELKDRLAIKTLPDEDRGRYNTLAGMVMLLLGRLPQTTDKVEWDGWRFEVVDMDGKRIDKILATQFKDD
ncbi:MAG: HlyC/CorC family transporter [Aquabacterium sp.]|jgi:putative hemolysin|uniref:hemolysin family protein n=1 Tax=Aquabacterium sp. TaxID=1872578 RepID=UPI001B75B30F|nr:hemolysin family protein [Aquabacterium sp.]MBP7132282.1 HlyC/CorC family transporter [Aquabacterium sp.]MBP9063678.1 HlyC/CorC family transporter [Aquabacterium sp.]